MKTERNILKPAPAIRAGAAVGDLDAERQRLAAILARAAVPDACGPRIIPAPARGAFKVAPQSQLLPNGADGWVQADAGFAGYQPIRAADVFDLMLRSAERAGLAAPFTPGQVEMGRRYRALVERHDAGGIKCSDLIGRPGGAGGDFMDAYLAEGRELAALRRRIGDRAALSVRRVRPGARGGAGRRNIPDRALVDMVCLGNRSPSDVLRAHGWAVKGDTRKAVAAALCGALDRMAGYRDEKTS